MKKFNWGNVKVTVKLAGSIFDSNCELLVNPVNCVGVMGAGLAKQFKERFPINYKNYKRFCDKDRLKLGSSICFGMEKGKYVINIPTKNHYREKSNEEMVLKSFRKVIDTLLNSTRYKDDTVSVAFPMIGCGLGGLNKEKMLNNMMDILKEYGDIGIYNNIEVEIYYL